MPSTGCDIGAVELGTSLSTETKSKPQLSFDGAKEGVFRGDVNLSHPELQPFLVQFAAGISPDIMVLSSTRYPDATGQVTMYRFLKTNKFDVDAALAHYREWRNWLVEHRVLHTRAMTPNPLYQGVISGDILGVDRQGHPMYIEKCGLVNIERMLSGTDADWEQYCIHSQETAAFLMHRQATRKGLPLHRLRIMADFRGLSLKIITRTSSRSRIRAAIEKRYYPSSCVQLIMTGIPTGMTTPLSVIGAFMDPEKTALMHTLTGEKHEVAEKLSQWVAADQLPQEYGGTRPDETCFQENHHLFVPGFVRHTNALRKTLGA